MKKLSKLMALLLSLLMILSLFAACGDDKKDDDDKEDASVSDEKDKDNKDEDEDEDEDVAVSAEDMLIGEWECEMEEDGVPSMIMTFNFYDDNTVETSITKDSYDDFVDVYVAEAMADVTDEEIEEEGFASRKEAEEFVREMLEEELPYDDFAAEFEMEGTWELDGDTLTIETDDGGILTAETDLSDGGTTITFVNEDGDELVIKKAK